MTLNCPLCGSQLVVRLLLPTPEHRDFKRPQVLSAECATPSCGVDRDSVRELLHMPASDGALSG
jgi:hypothetical protein